MSFVDQKGCVSYRMPQEIVCKRFETVAELRCRLQEKLALRPSEARARKPSRAVAQTASCGG